VAEFSRVGTGSAEPDACAVPDATGDVLAVIVCSAEAAGESVGALEVLALALTVRVLVLAPVFELVIVADADAAKVPEAVAAAESEEEREVAADAESEGERELDDEEAAESETREERLGDAVCEALFEDEKEGWEALALGVGKPVCVFAARRVTDTLAEELGEVEVDSENLATLDALSEEAKEEVLNAVVETVSEGEEDVTGESDCDEDTLELGVDEEKVELEAVLERTDAEEIPDADTRGDRLLVPLTVFVADSLEERVEKMLEEAEAVMTGVPD
jgi:hypothetical protein